MIKKLFIAVFALIAATGAQAAKVDTVAIATKYIATPEKVVVITPDAAIPGETFPTVYLLNGYGGNHKAWLGTRPDLPTLADRYGMVMVLPDGRDSWYWDSPKMPDMQMESFFVKDLVPYIDAHYPTRRDAAHRAITGLSMGGQGAMWLAMRHSDIWGNAGSMSGGLDIRPFPDRWKMKNSLGAMEENPDVWEKHAVINLIPTLQPGQLNITFDCGIDDFFAEVNDNFHRELVKAKIPHDYTVRPGGHSQAYWRNSILYHLLFFNEAFNKANDKK